MSRTLPVLLWDWDGTLVDSLMYKYVDIWKKVFPEENKKQILVQEYIQTPEGKSQNRYGLITYALAHTDAPELLDASDKVVRKDTRVTDAVARYDAAARAHVYQTGVVAGAADTLKQLHERGYHMYLLSGGGTDSDLSEMTEYVGIKEYFKGFFGFGVGDAPLASFGKEENLKRIMKNEQLYDPEHYLMVGDSKSDQQFAESAGTHFVGVANEWNGWSKTTQNFLTIEYIKEVPSIIKEL